MRSSRNMSGNARVAGLEKGLHLTDKQYQIAVTVTYVCVFVGLIFVVNAPMELASF